LISSLCELTKVRKKYIRAKEQLETFKEKSYEPVKISEETEQIITTQQIQIEEARKIKESMLGQLIEKEVICQAREGHIVYLRR
jgi:hypothetical protein